MGLDCNTPRALIFGPLSYGGFEFHDIYCEQLQQHLVKITQHIRREDNAGKAMMSNIRMLSCILESSRQLFQLPRTRYIYMVKEGQQYISC